ncbi:RNA polymerase sigma factor [Lentzea sp. HUAS TT2]|uniref:RNA polymerase sigma factor n=1 Tax=Lentzea sp. HUAS TT2 TaxID=3447454 RepID=UPI003F713B4E
MTDDNDSDASLEAFYTRWSGGLLRYIRRHVSCPADAQDIAQEVWTVVCKRLGDGPVPEGYSAFLFTVAHNKIVDFYRARSRDRSVPLDPVLEVIGDPAFDPAAVRPAQLSHLAEHILDAHEALPAVLGQLTELQRNAVLYRHYVGMSVSEVAQSLSVEHYAAKRFLVVGLKKIRSLLAQAGHPIRVSTKEMP